MTLSSGTNLAFMVYVPNNLKHHKLTLRQLLLVSRNAVMHGQILVIAVPSVCTILLFSLNLYIFISEGACHCKFPL